MTPEMILTWELGAIELLTDNIYHMATDRMSYAVFSSYLTSLKTKMAQLESNDSWAEALRECTKSLVAVGEKAISEDDGYTFETGVALGIAVQQVRNCLQMYKRQAKKKEEQKANKLPVLPPELEELLPHDDQPIQPWRPQTQPFRPDPSGAPLVMLYGAADSFIPGGVKYSTTTVSDTDDGDDA